MRRKSWRHERRRAAIQATLDDALREQREYDKFPALLLDRDRRLDDVIAAKILKYDKMLADLDAER